MPTGHAAIIKPLETYWSCVFPVGEEPDWGIVGAIRREVMPNFVPLWCVKDYITPANTVYAQGFYVLGQWLPAPDEHHISQDQEPLKVLIPSRSPDFPFSGGVIYEEMSWTVKWPPGSEGLRMGLPEVPLPFDGRVYDYVARQVYENRRSADADPVQSIKRAKKWIAGRAQRDREYLAKLDAEADLRLRDEDRNVKRAIETGNFLDQPRESTPKPFVHLRS